MIRSVGIGSYNKQTLAHISKWATRMVDIEFNADPAQYKAQMGALITDIKDYATDVGINYSNLYESVWNETKPHLNPDIFKD